MSLLALAMILTAVSAPAAADLRMLDDESQSRKTLGTYQVGQAQNHFGACKATIKIIIPRN